MGPPGALLTQWAMGPSSGGGRFGPPTPTCRVVMKVVARYVSQWGSG